MKCYTEFFGRTYDFEMLHLGNYFEYLNEILTRGKYRYSEHTTEIWLNKINFRMAI